MILFDDIPKEAYLVFGAVITAFVALIVAQFNGSTQFKIAMQNSQKDIQLQTDRLAEERLKNEVALQREKLEKLHKILSNIAFENSLTMSFLHLEEFNVSNFRKKFIENCDKLNEALAITDLYSPDLSEDVRVIFGKANLFWGHQDIAMQPENKAKEQPILINEVRLAGIEINKRVEFLQNQIAEKGKALEKKMQ